jgi:hypothetical protein
MTREDVRKAAADPSWIDTTALEPTSWLHSVQGTRGCHIQALDGRIGSVEDLLADDDHWAIRYLAVDTSQWIGGSVLVPSEWTRRVDSETRLVHVDRLREDLKSCLAARRTPARDPYAVMRSYDTSRANASARSGASHLN